MSNELAVFGLGDMQKMAESIARSGLFGMKTADQALALMLVAQAEGQHPATITQDYDLIQGKACRKTHSVMARFQQMGGKVEWHQLDDTIADATFSHAAGGSLRMTWTFEQAKKAGLTGKDNWVKYPRAMLRARVIAEGVRAVYPAAIGGLLVAEEAQDLSPKDMGAVEQVVRKDPTSIATEAARVEHDDSTLSLIADLELIAKEQGIEAYQQAWTGISKEARQSIGAAEHSRLKDLCAQATVIDAETGEIV